LPSPVLKSAILLTDLPAYFVGKNMFAISSHDGKE